MNGWVFEAVYLIICYFGYIQGSVVCSFIFTPSVNRLTNPPTIQRQSGQAENTDEGEDKEQREAQVCHLQKKQGKLQSFRSPSCWSHASFLSISNFSLYILESKA